MSLRVVVYGEGVGDTGGETSQLPPPGNLLADTHLGPAHELLRRCIVRESSISTAGVLFLCPLRLPSGRHAKGSDLLVNRSLRRLLTWPVRERRPDIAIVIVDQDGQKARRATLLSFTEGLSLRHAVAVPIQEFEAWLIADHGAVVRALGHSPNQLRSIETLDPREAKEQLAAWTAASAHAADPKALRMTLARTVDLAILDKLSAFKLFRQDLRAAIIPA